MIREFQQYVTVLKGQSENTAKAYGKDLRAFARWMRDENENARWSTITRDDIDKYVTWQTAAGLTPATINRHLAAISGIYRYMQRQGYKVENPARYASRKKIGSRVPATISPADLEAAMNTGGKDVRMAIRLLYVTGMRTSELCNLRTEDCMPRELTAIVRGKGDKERKVYMDAETADDLEAYIAGRRGLVFGWSERELRYHVWQQVHKVSNAKQTNPRAIRHTFATTIAKQGGNATTIAALMGHKSIKTSQHYIDMAGTEVQRQYNQLNLFS